MLCPKCFFECGFVYLVAFRTNVFYIIEVVPADQYAPGNSHQHPDDERPPNAFDDPENDERLLQCRDQYPGQDHHPVHLFQFFLAFHYDKYMTKRNKQYLTQGDFLIWNKKTESPGRVYPWKAHAERDVKSPANRNVCITLRIIQQSCILRNRRHFLQYNPKQVNRVHFGR